MKPKIAFVSNSSFSLWNFRYPVMKKLKELGYHVLAIAPEDEFSGNLKEHFEFKPLKNLNRKSTNPIRELLLFNELFKLYKAEKPDLVIHYTIKPNIWGSMASGLLKIPSIAFITGLGHVFTETNKNSYLEFIVRTLYKFALSFSYRVVFLNPDDAELFRKNNIVRSDKIKIIQGEGIDTYYFKPIEVKKKEDKVFKFIYIGRLLRSKGVLELIEASKDLKNRHYNLEIIMVGDIDEGNPDSLSFSELSNLRNLNYIKILGFQKDVRPFIAESDCLVLPSYREGIPRVVLEAMAMAKPVIVTNAPGCKETVIDGVNGFLVEPKSVESLRNAMEKMINLPEEVRRKMGEASRHVVLKKFDMQIIVNEYINLINEALDQRNK